MKLDPPLVKTHSSHDYPKKILLDSIIGPVYVNFHSQLKILFNLPHLQKMEHFVSNYDVVLDFPSLNKSILGRKIIMGSQGLRWLAKNLENTL